MSDIGAEATSMLDARDDAATALDTPAGSKDDSSVKSIARDGLPPTEEKALVDEILKKIKEWKKHHEDAFKAMREDVRFAANKYGAQWNGKKISPVNDEYVANITFRHIQSRTGVLYAKNPQVKAKRRKRLDYKVWDGTEKQIAQAKQAIDAANGIQPPGPPPDPAMVKAQAQIKFEEAKTAAQIALLNAQTQLAQTQAGIKQQEAQAKAAADQTEHALQIETARLSSIQEMKQTQEKHQNDIAIAQQGAATANKIALEKHNHEMQVARDMHSQDLKISADKADQDAELKEAQAAQAEGRAPKPVAKTSGPAKAPEPDPHMMAAIKAMGDSSKSIEKLGAHIGDGMKAQAEGHKVLAKAMTAKVKITKGADGSWNRTHEE